MMDIVAELRRQLVKAEAEVTEVQAKLRPLLDKRNGLAQAIRALTGEPEKGGVRDVQKPRPSSRESKIGQLVEYIRTHGPTKRRVLHGKGFHEYTISNAKRNGHVEIVNGIVSVR